MPASLQARTTRTAISPRLAMRTFCSGLTLCSLLGTTLLCAGRILRESIGRALGASRGLALRASNYSAPHDAAPVRPDRRGRAPVGGALGRRPPDARGDLTDAGAAARAGPARRAAQAAGAHVRPLRGAGAAHVLLAGVAAPGEDGRAAASPPDLGHLDRPPARGRPARRTSSASGGRPRRTGRDHPAGAVARRPGDG